MKEAMKRPAKASKVIGGRFNKPMIASKNAGLKKKRGKKKKSLVKKKKGRKRIKERLESKIYLHHSTITGHTLGKASTILEEGVVHIFAESHSQLRKT